MAIDFNITLKEANKLVSNFIRQFNSTNLEVIGGVIQKESFIKNAIEQYKGTMCWFGLNGNTLKLFFEPNQDYDPGRVPTFPSSHHLWESQFLINRADFPNPNSLIPINDLKLTLPLNLKDLMVPRIDVLDQVANFYWDFPKNGVESFNKFPLGFFETTKFPEVIKFLNNGSIQYIVYLFGLDLESEEYKKNNQIRIILAGMNSKGELLLPVNENLIEEPYLLQKSWPPPPKQ